MDDQYWDAKMMAKEKAEAELKELGKARRCDEIIIEQLKAEVEELKRFITDLDEQQMCLGHGAWDLYEEWKAQKEGM